MVGNLKSYIKLKIKTKENEKDTVEQHVTSSLQQQAEPLTVKTSIGVYLQEARVKTGLSINQVSQQTRIHIHYMEAIERNDFASTPPFIYIKAYVKKLCALYKISEDTAMTLLEVYESERAPLPEKVLQNLEETKQVNKGDVEKIRSYVKFIGMSVASFVILLTILGAVLISKKDRDIVDNPLTVREKSQLQKNMEKLVASQWIDINELKPVVNNN